MVARLPDPIRYAAVAASVGLFTIMLSPVFVDPLFNTYKPLRDGEMRQAILSLAHANQIPTDNVVEFDASKQTMRISANVAGFAGTTGTSLGRSVFPAPAGSP